MMRLVVFLVSVFIHYSCSEQNRGVDLPAKLHLASPGKQTSSEHTNITSIQNKRTVDNLIAYADSLWVSDTQTAKNILWDAIDESKTINYSYGIVKSLFKLGITYSNWSLDSALHFFHLALQYTHQLPPEKCVAEFIYANIGVMFHQHARFDSALLYIYKGLEQLEQHGIESYWHAFFVYKIAGVVWINLDNINTSVTYFNKAEKMARLSGDSSLLMEMEHVKATLYYKRGLLDSALLCYQNIIEHSATPLWLSSEANVNLGMLYAKDFGQPEKSIPYFKEGYRLFRKSADFRTHEQIRYLYPLGVGYLNKAIKEHNKRDMNMAYRIFSMINDRKGKLILAEDLPEFYSNLALVYETKGNYKQANVLRKAAFEERERIYKKDMLEVTSKLDVKYRIAEKDGELAQKKLMIMETQNKVINRDKQLILLGLVASVIIAILATRYIYIRQKNRKLESMREMERLKAKIEGEEQERTKIAYDLHDSVNSRLAATQSYLVALTDEYPHLKHSFDFNSIVQTLQDTSVEVRQIAHNLLPGDLQLKGLCIAVKDFCISLFMPRGIKVDVQSFGSFETLPMSLCLNLYRIVQELSHNIVKHAQATEVIVILGNSNGELSLLIEDNGKGMDALISNQDSTGIGLKGLQERVKMQNGSLNIETVANVGTTINIVFKHSSGIQRESV